MPSVRWWAAAAVAVAPVLSCAAQTAPRLSATAPRVLAAGASTAVGADGTERAVHATLTYEPATGAYVRTATDPTTGAVVAREAQMGLMIGPSADEDAAARALIGADRELAALVAAAPAPVTIDGGFPLVREAGHACSGAARCLQYDLFYPVAGRRGAQRLRFVVVDVRTLALVDRDFDPAAEGNRATPASRRPSPR